MEQRERKDRVLVVDDIASNIDILLDMLGEDYEIIVAMDGESALKCVAEMAPDIILLDIMMPGIDGYEVCRRLKNNQTTQDIPIIFLSALHDDQDEETGLTLGAVDYITKPFTPSLVKVRVENQLTLLHTRRTVIEQRDHIEENYRQLCQLEQRRDELVHMLVHDLRAPLTGLCGNLEYTLRYSNSLDDDTRDCLQTALDSGNDLCNMICSVLDVSKLESGEFPLEPRECNLTELIHNSVQELGSLINSHQLSLPEGENPVSAYCDPDVIERVIANLIANAIKFTPPGGQIHITLDRQHDAVRLSIRDNGPGIPHEHQEKVFEKFGQLKSHRYSTGLGLAFCKLAIEAHGGDIYLESEPGQGTTFHITLTNPETR